MVYPKKKKKNPASRSAVSLEVVPSRIKFLGEFQRGIDEKFNSPWPIAYSAPMKVLGAIRHWGKKKKEAVLGTSFPLSSTLSENMVLLRTMVGRARNSNDVHCDVNVEETN
ncbi:hypothetical protein SLEP1_g11928 [Rubroshorea leprosula]|nr:hypothetical protein SLEP1_g11928 [Rubroshorea leprosula]